MAVVDLVLLGLAVLFAWAGWRQGLIRGALSMAGFLGGALLAVAIVPNLIASWNLPVMTRGLISIGAVIAVAAIGQALAAWLGRTLRDNWDWRPAELLDSVGGAVFYVVALALVVWVVASALVLLPTSSLAQQIKASTVVAGIDAAVPPPARRAVSGMQALLNSTGFPRVFSALAEPPALPVEPPDAGALLDPSLKQALASVVRVEGEAVDCSTQITGSGFVFAPRRVMTNAHVVAGVTSPTVQVRGSGDLLDATVVYFDPELDVAVLEVPDITAPPLRWGGVAEPGSNAAVAGFPRGGPLDVEAARIRDQLTARGEDIYGADPVVRDIYSIRSSVLPGDSGGPLLSTKGRVLGVVFAAAIHDSTTGYALTAGQVSEAATTGRTARGAVDTGTCVPK